MRFWKLIGSGLASLACLGFAGTGAAAPIALQPGESVLFNIDARAFGTFTGVDFNASVLDGDPGDLGRLEVFGQFDGVGLVGTTNIDLQVTFFSSGFQNFASLMDGLFSVRFSVLDTSVSGVSLDRFRARIFDPGVTLGTIALPQTAVPEPASLALVGLALVAASVAGWRRRA